MATAVVVGTVIGSGVFKKPQVVAENVPYFGLAALAWVLGGVLAILGALAIAEVAVIFPRAGGNYVFLREGFGPLWGFLWCWVEFWIVKPASIAALATLFADSLRDVLINPGIEAAVGPMPGGSLDGYWVRRWLTVAVILGLALINVLGVKWGGRLQLFITTIKVASLLGLIVLPFLAIAFASPTASIPEPALPNLAPIWPVGEASFPLTAFGAAVIGVLWAYHGWMNITPVAEEIRAPQRNIPRALFGGIGLIICLYLGANLAYALIIPAKEMATIRDTTVATVFSQRLLGSIGGAVASAAVMVSVFGALNGNLLVAPRVVYALSEDGLAPRALAAVHPRFRTPARAIWLVGVWSSLLILGAAALAYYRLPAVTVFGHSFDVNVPKSKPLFDIMTDFAMFGAVGFETLAVATVFPLRRRLPDVERPYRCWGYPLTPALYIVLLSLVLLSMFLNQRTEAITGVGFILVGAMVYGIIRSRRTSRGI